MDNFAVVAHLGSPVILTNGRLTLDSILAAQIYRETEDFDYANTHIPLLRTDGVWHGSAALFSMGDLHFAPFGRSMKIDDMENGCWKPLRGNYPSFIDQARNKPGVANQWRSMFNTYVATASDKVIWFGCGDIVSVRRLMTSLIEGGGVGKKTSHGYGRINEVNVVPMQGDYSLALPDGRPARPVPVDVWLSMGGAATPSVARETFVSPYFDNNQAVSCVVPPVRFLSASEWRSFRRMAG